MNDTYLIFTVRKTTIPIIIIFNFMMIDRNLVNYKIEKKFKALNAYDVGT